MANLSDLFSIPKDENPYADRIRELHIAIDRDGEVFEDLSSRLAFYRAVVDDVMGRGAAYDAPYHDIKFKDLNGQTPFDTVVKNGPEGLKTVVSHLVKHYSM